MLGWRWSRHSSAALCVRRGFAHVCGFAFGESGIICRFCADDSGIQVLHRIRMG